MYDIDFAYSTSKNRFHYFESSHMNYPLLLCIAKYFSRAATMTLHVSKNKFYLTFSRIFLTVELTISELASTYEATNHYPVVAQGT